MSLRQLLFVSESRLPADAEAEQLRAIIPEARDRNAAIGVTSALVAARGQFAQVVEGPDDSVGMLMESISRDPRHDRVTIVLTRTSGSRLFPNSPMALVYSGASFYVARHITPLLPADGGVEIDPAAAAQLLYLIRELAQPHGP
jgi:hypothetical protein